MENDIASMYAMRLNQALRSGNYESYGSRMSDSNLNDMQLQLIEPSMSIAGQNINQSFIPTSGQLPIGAYTGEIAFRIIRATSNINAPLPIPFGSAFAFSQNYQQVLESVLPAGVNIDSVVVNVPENKITITYVQGANIDVIELFGDTYNLIAFNQGLYTRKAITNVVRYTTPEISAIYNQVSSTPSRPFTSTWLSNSKVDRNTLSLTPMQFNRNVFDMIAPSELSEEKGFIMYTFPLTATPGVSQTYNVQMFFSVIGKV